MPLEATILVLDNSAYALNGDYAPTRYSAQSDCAAMLFQSKTSSNPESAVGLMLSSPATVLVTPTQDSLKFQGALHGAKLAGVPDWCTSISVACLALKHRSNKLQKQRVVLFVGSPIQASPEALVKLGKKCKKNNVAIDVVSFGEIDANEAALRGLIEAVDSSGNSHFVEVPAARELLLSDVVLSSAILAEERQAAGGSGGEGGAAEGSGEGGFGVDPNLDPELAMALRMSLEDERARQAAQSPAPTAASASADGSAAPAAASPLETITDLAASSPIDSTPAAAAPSTTLPRVAGTTYGDENMQLDPDEDAELARALAMSRGEDVEMADDDDGPATADGSEEEEDEEEEIRKAIALSLQGESAEKDK